MVLQLGRFLVISIRKAWGEAGSAMARDSGNDVSLECGDALLESPLAGDILRAATVSISPAIESHMFDSPGALLADLEAHGYLWTWGYVTEEVRHGLVTWRVVLRADLPVPSARELLAASTPYVPKDAICSAGVPEARLHPNTVLSITAFSPGAVAACRRWLAADFLPRALPRLLALSPSPAASSAGRAEDLLDLQPIPS
jgi:hypothetical protein